MPVTRTRLFALWAIAFVHGRPVHEEVRPVRAAIAHAGLDTLGHRSQSPGPGGFAGMAFPCDRVSCLFSEVSEG